VCEDCLLRTTNNEVDKLSQDPEDADTVCGGKNHHKHYVVGGGRVQQDALQRILHPLSGNAKIFKRDHLRLKGTRQRLGVRNIYDGEAGLKTGQERGKLGEMTGRV